MKKITKFLSHRVVLVGVSLFVQFLILLLMITIFDRYFIYFSITSTLLSILVVVYILSSKTNPSYKIAWVIPIIIFPIFGGLLYLFFGGNKLGKREKNKMNSIYKNYKNSYQQDENVLQQLKKMDENAYRQAYYINQKAFSLVYQNTVSTYFKLGDD